MSAWLWWPLTAAGLFLLVWGLNRLLDFMFPTTRIYGQREHTDITSRECTDLDDYRQTRNGGTR